MAASAANADAGPTSATSAPPMAGPISVASCVPPEISAFPAWRSSPSSSAGTIANEPGMNSPAPDPSTTAMGTSTTARAGPRAAVTASAPTPMARTASVAIMTVHGRHRSLRCPPTRSSAVRGMP